MANNYKVKVQVDIEKCADTTTAGLGKEDVGVFEWVVSAEQARSIDGCEQIVIETNYDALRDVFAHHHELVKTLLSCSYRCHRFDQELGVQAVVPNRCLVVQLQRLMLIAQIELFYSLFHFVCFQDQRLFLPSPMESNRA